MKKLIYLKFVIAIMFSMILMGCPPEPELSEIRVSPTSINVDANATIQNISIKSNTKWSVSTNGTSWVKVTTSSGEGDSSTNIHIEGNREPKDRVAVLTFTTNDGSAQAACTINQQKMESTLSVSESEINAGAAATTKTVRVYSNAKWKISDSPSWVTITPNSGNGDTDITIKVGENTNTNDRTATITVATEDNKLTAKINVKQKGVDASISVNPSNITFSSVASSVKGKVTSNTGWSAVSSESWLQVSPSNGEGNSEITITAESNENTSGRTGKITLKTKDGSAQSVINVNQNGVSQSISVNPSSISAGASKSSVTVSIKSNTSWNITTNQSWVSTSKSSGTGNSDITVNISQNSSSSNRNAQITVKSTDGSTSCVIDITQSGAVPSISVTPSNIEVGTSECSTSVDLTSNSEWQAYSSANWVTIQNSTGSGNAKVTLNVDKNTGYEREAKITFSTKDGSAQSIVTLKQSGVTPSITATPSNISISSSKQTVSVKVNANVKWSAQTSEYWVAVNPASGDGNANLNLTISENTYSTSRNATVTIKSDNGKYSATIYIQQSGASDKTTELSVNPTSLSLGANAGESKTFTIKSNTTWSVVECPNWVSLQISGSNTYSTAKVTTRSANNASSRRSGYIRIRTNNQEKTESVIVVQECNNTETNCKVEVNNAITLNDALAYDLKFGTSVYQFKILVLSASAAANATESEILSAIKNKEAYSYSTHQNTMFYYNNLSANTNYKVYTIGMNSSGVYGDLSTFAIKTKSASSVPYTNINNVSYNGADGKWHWSTEKNSYANTFYMVVTDGTYDDVDQIYGREDIVVAWWMNRMIKTYPNTFGKLYSYSSHDWSVSRSNGCDHLIITTWSTYSNGNMSGGIRKFNGKLTNSSGTISTQSQSNTKAGYINESDIRVNMFEFNPDMFKNGNIKIYEVTR